jgi:hypothetical protein
MPCAESTARTHLRNLPAVASSASALRSLAPLLAEHATDARHAASAAVWLRTHISGEPSRDDLRAALKQTAPKVAPKRAHDPNCRLCVGVGYVQAPPLFVGGNMYPQVRECSCWSVQS